MSEEKSRYGLVWAMTLLCAVFCLTSDLVLEEKRLEYRQQPTKQPPQRNALAGLGMFFDIGLQKDYTNLTTDFSTMVGTQAVHVRFNFHWNTNGYWVPEMEFK
jgi:hypothetical protein